MKSFTEDQLSQHVELAIKQLAAKDAEATIRRIPRQQLGYVRAELKVALANLAAKQCKSSAI